MDAVTLCVLLCLLSSTSAMAVWSLCEFWAQTSRRAARCATRRKGDLRVARRESERRATSKAAVFRAGGAESPERGPPAQRRYASDLGPASGSKKLLPRSSSCDHLLTTDQSKAHGRPAKAGDTKSYSPATAPAQSADAVPAAPRRRTLPRSSSFDRAVAPAKARETKANAPTTAPAQSTDAVPAGSRRHSLPAQSTDAVPAGSRRPPLPAQSTDAVPAGSRRRSLPRSSSELLTAQDRAAAVALSAGSGGPSGPGSSNSPSALAPGGPPVMPPSGLLARSTSFERMRANDQDCPPTPLPRTAQARKPVSSSGSLNYANLVFKRLTETELTVY
jgi:hypothetical protein